MDNYRFSIKIAGQSGQGIDTLGKILTNAFTEMGYFVVGYREYPSLIKGGNATFQIDISSTQIFSTTKFANILFVINEQKTNWYENTITNNGVIIHDLKNPSRIIDEVIINSLNITVKQLDTDSIISQAGGSPKMKNIAILSSLVTLGILEQSVLNSSISNHFKDNTIISSLNQKVVSTAIEYYSEDETLLSLKNKIKFSQLAVSSKQIKSINGTEAIINGITNSNVKYYFAYPMTPTSNILTILAEQKNAGLHVEQVDDEITAVAACMGVNLTGKRALTATSGGGFDLMTEHISFSMMSEIPLVVILGQRPGPATGMPTWTAQGDLLTSIYSGHGEGARVVMGISDIYDAEYIIPQAFDIAEKFKVPVIVLTDKYINESLFTKDLTYKFKLTNPHPETKTNKSICYNSDEHDGKGNAIEDSENAIKNAETRMKKYQDILADMDVPEIISDNKKQYKKTVKFITWGSSKGTVLDLMQISDKFEIKVELLHIKNLWPLKLTGLETYIKEAIIIEENISGQLENIIFNTTGVRPKNRYRKYDGRPIYLDDLINFLSKIID